MSDRELRVGDKRLFMTGAFHWLGEVVRVTPTEVWLDKCSFVDNLGPMTVAETGKIWNSEYVGDGVELKRHAYICSLPWGAALPMKNVSNG